MKDFLNRYYVTVLYATLLFIFSFSITETFTYKLGIFVILYLFVIGNLFIGERKLAKHYTLQEKNVKMMYSFVPINLIIIILMIIFVF